MSTLLQAQGLTKRFGGLVAVEDLDLDINAGTIVGVIGPNGAGKSTLISLLGGALAPSAGRIHFDGEEISSVGPAARARLGIGRTYQVPRPFLDMTVEDNLAVAQSAHRRGFKDGTASARRRELLQDFGLIDVSSRLARELPLLRRKRLEVARALALEPKLLLLDEVGAGLIDSEVSELIALIHAVAARGTTILIVEHVLRIVRECCSRLIVLNFGRQIAAGATADVLASDHVAAVYLGTAHRSGTQIITNTNGTAIATAAATAATAVPPSELQSLVDAAGAAGAEPFLRLQDVSAAYGQLPVLRQINLQVNCGEVVAILGANGAGKTSLANVVCGALRARSGRLLVGDRDVTQLRADRIAALGIAHCMEGRRIFPNLSVEQNLLLAARAAPRATVSDRLQAVYRLFPVLAERRREAGTDMSGGQQQMLAIARALMARPRLVIFDEISLGLAPIIMDRLYEALAALKQAGLTMMIVEQDVDRALALADRAYVMEHGSMALEASAASVRSDPRLRQLYFGSASPPTQ